jgi:hypothetical protein
MFDRVIRLASLLILLTTLAACGNNGPSKAAAGAALSDLVSQFAGLLPGGEQKIQIKVDDLKCQKQGDDIYNCQVLATVNGQQAQDSYEFTKLGGKWRARHVQ